MRSDFGKCSKCCRRSLYVRGQYSWLNDALTPPSSGADIRPCRLRFRRWLSPALRNRDLVCNRSMDREKSARIKQCATPNVSSLVERSCFGGSIRPTRAISPRGQPIRVCKPLQSRQWSHPDQGRQPLLTGHRPELLEVQQRVAIASSRMVRSGHKRGGPAVPSVVSTSEFCRSLPLAHLEDRGDSLQLCGTRMNLARLPLINRQRRGPKQPCHLCL